MTHVGRLHDYRFSDKSVDDIRGSNIYGLEDDKLGKIDDLIFDHTTGEVRYVVVDTGGWLSSKRFIVPADRLRPSVEHEDDYIVSLTKEQIEAFPPYDENAVESQEKWNDYETRYRASWTDTPVMHQEGTDRTVTPTNAGSGLGSRLGNRWSRFEDRLRTERTHAIGSCNVCGAQPASETIPKRKVG